MNLSFSWPAVLWGLLLIPALVALYARVLRRPRRSPVTFTNVELLRRASLQGGWVRRHLPAALFLVALATLVAALARPVVPLPVPVDRSALMIAIDVSGSMRSRDIYPSRVEAAKAAARALVAALPSRVQVGLVAFSGYAALMVPPVTDHARVIDEIDGLRLGRRTAIGEGLLEAVAALPGRVRPSGNGTLPPVPAGPKPPGIVVLLSDGQNNTGIDPLTAAELARQQEVRVYTVGIGQPATPENTWVIGGPLDEDTLRTVAIITGGTYHHASSAQELRTIYKSLARSVGWVVRPTEVSAISAGLGLTALLAAVLASRLLVHPTGL